MVQLEICIDSVAGAIAAEQGGADRLEICGNLVEGGTTPSMGMICAVLEVTSLPVMVMIRPRGGPFCFTKDEKNVMRRDAQLVLEQPIAGIVMGAAGEDGSIDEAFCEEIRRLSMGRSMTFHRAFDQLKEPVESLEKLVRLGVDRLLTSGQAPTAMEGVELIRQLVDISADRIVVMPGGGVRAENIADLVAECEVTEVHGTASDWASPFQGFWRDDVPMCAASGPLDLVRRVTADHQVRAMKTALVEMA